MFWDQLGTNSCWHGVTYTIMGNCGFSLAPCAEQHKSLVFSNLERAEEISPAAMEEGIAWSWTTYREYLQTLDRLPKGTNYGGYAGHSARRAFDKTMTDPAYLAESGRAHLEVDPITGETMTRMIKGAYALPKEMIARAAKVATIEKN